MRKHKLRMFLHPVAVNKVGDYDGFDALPFFVVETDITFNGMFGFEVGQ